MRDLMTGRKVKVFIYNSQVTSPTTESMRALAEQSGVTVVGITETIPKPTESFADWQLGQLNAIGAALSGTH